MTAGPEYDHRVEHEAIGELLGAYALDAVAPEEADLVEHHLFDCRRCRTEVDQHREMAAALGNSVLSLPPALWDRIAQQLAATPRWSVGGGPAPLLTALPSEGGEERTGGRLQGKASAPAPRKPARVLRWTMAAVAAAAVALIAVLSVNLTHTNNQLGRARQALTGVADATAFQTALSTPGHRVVSLQSPSGPSVGEVVVVPGGRGYLLASSMPALSADQTYQLWALFGAKAISLGLLGNHPKGAAFTISSGTPTQLALTVEPAGGVSTPDRLPVATGSLAT